MAKLKVYGTSSYFLPGIPGQLRVIVAVPNKKRLSELLKLSLWNINQWWTKTGNEHELKIALEKPEAVFYRPLDNRDCEYQEYREAKR